MQPWPRQPQQPPQQPPQPRGAVPDRIGKRPASIANSDVFTSVEHTRGSKVVRDEYAIDESSRATSCPRVTRSITWIDRATGDEIQYLLKGPLGGTLRLTKYFRNKATGVVEIDYSDDISSAESESRYGMPGMAAAILFDIPDFLGHHQGGPAPPPPPQQQRQQPQPATLPSSSLQQRHQHATLPMNAFTFVPITIRNPEGAAVTAFLPLVMTKGAAAAQQQQQQQRQGPTPPRLLPGPPPPAATTTISASAPPPPSAATRARASVM